MGKSDLIGKGLWAQYSGEVRRRMNDPKYRGEIAECGDGERIIVADHGAESCGDAVRLFWLIEIPSRRDSSSVSPVLDTAPESAIYSAPQNILDSHSPENLNLYDGKIRKARFESFGCGTAIAANDAMCELCEGKTVSEALKITNVDVEAFLRDDPETPAVPPQKMHCSVMAYDVIKKAASEYLGRPVTESDEIVCECAQVSLGTIREAIKVNKLTTVDEVTNFTKAGGYCKSCVRPGGHEKRKYYIVDILAEMNVGNVSGEKNFVALTESEGICAVERVLNLYFRRVLASRGETVKVVGVSGWDVVLELKSADENIKSVIEVKIKSGLGEKINLIWV